MSNVASNTETDLGSRIRIGRVESDLANRALDHTCWFLSQQLTGKRNDRKFDYRVVDGQGFIQDKDRVEVAGSRKPIEKWVEIGRQLRLAEAVIWLKVGKYPKPSKEPDPAKRVRFRWSFDGLRRVFVFEATRGRKQLSDKEINERYHLHRRLWVLASQGEAIEQLYSNFEAKLSNGEQVLETLSRVGEQLGLLKSSFGEAAGAMHPQFSPRRSIAYSG